MTRQMLLRLHTDELVVDNFAATVKTADVVVCAWGK